MSLKSDAFARAVRHRHPIHVGAALRKAAARFVLAGGGSSMSRRTRAPGSR